jgi:putative membrane protein
VPLLVFTWILFASPAAAHGGAPVAPGELWNEWRPDLLLSVAFALVAIAYCRGLVRLWTRAGIARGVTTLEAAAFAVGLFSLAVALLSPLEAATGTLVSAHMAQHVVLVALAPPLILLGRPDAVLAFAFPAAVKSARWFRRSGAAVRTLARPFPAATLHAVTLWVWHAPGPFQAALEHRVLHDLEHASFFVTALLFWQALVVAWRSPATVLPAIMATLITLIQGGFLAALITLTPRPLYPSYQGAELWGLTAMDDQRLAGLLMWVPAGAIYLLAGLMLASRLLASDERHRAEPRHGSAGVTE